MVELITGLLLLVLLGGLIWFGLKPKARGLDRAKFSRRWQETSALLGGGPSGHKLAVIEADKLLDVALKAKGFTGETMGERLKSAGAGLGNRNEQNAIWNAHRLRNRLVHEETKVSQQQALQALNVFKKCLKQLGAL